MNAPDNKDSSHKIPPFRPRKETGWRETSEPRSHRVMAWVFGSIFMVIFLLAMLAIVGIIDVPYPPL